MICRQYAMGMPVKMKEDKMLKSKKIFISGGCKNGKSMYAQKRASELASILSLPLFYVATMIPHDEEDERRIKRHLQERDGWGFITVEQPLNIHKIFDRAPKEGVFLLDSLTALTANEMFPPTGEMNLDIQGQLSNQLKYFLENASCWVVVSDYLYGGSRYDDITENYKKTLAHMDQLTAAMSNEVIEVSAGIPQIWHTQ